MRPLYVTLMFDFSLLFFSAVLFFNLCDAFNSSIFNQCDYINIPGSPIQSKHCNQLMCDYRIDTVGMFEIVAPLICPIRIHIDS